LESQLIENVGVPPKIMMRRAIALRTISEYANKFIELGLVLWDRALVRGKVRVFRIE